MSQKPTYEGLEQRVKELEEESIKYKQTEQAFRESEIRYRTSFDNSRDAINIFSKERKILDVNKKLVQHTEYSKEELLSMKLTDLYPESIKPPTEERIKKMLQGEEPHIFETYLLTKKGKKVPVEIGVAKLQNCYGQDFVFQSNIRDITKRKRAEEALQKAHDELEMRVDKRTAELTQTNERLKQEIKERKRTEEALRESEEKYHNLYNLMRLITDNVPDLIWAKDKDGLFLFVNQAMCDKLIMCGSLDKAIGKTDMFFADQERNAGYEHTFGETCVNSDAITKERKAPGRFIEDGLVRDKYLVLDVHKAPFLNEDGEMIGTVGCGRDVTNEKETEEALRDREETVRALLNATTDSVFLIDAEGTVIEMNKPGIKRLGLSPDEIIGRCIYDFLPADVTESRKAKVEEVFRSGKHIRFVDQRADMYLDKNIYPIFDMKGKVEKVAVFARDITEQKRVDDALLESEEKYRSLVESTEENIYLVDRNLRYLFANEQFQYRFGLPMDKIIGSKYGEFHSQAETKDFTENLNKVFETGRSLSYEYQSARDGKCFIRLLSPVKERGGRITSVTVISRDITGRKKTEEALKTANENLLKEHNERRILSKRLIDLLEKDRYEIARELHDHIGQVLTSLKINLEIIGSQLKPPKTELASQIKAAEQKAIQALKDIKSISHGLKPGILDTLGLKPSLRELFNNIQRDTDIKIKFFSRNIPKEIVPEKGLAIYRITQEALTNVIKHAQAKEVFVNLIKKEKNISLSIEDDGVGFDPDKTMKVMKIKGPLGLSIIQERTVQLDGEFTVESQIGQGTQVLVEIPI